ncbi:DUF2637 domain-containing protein [Micromonospora coxensis]
MSILLVVGLAAGAASFTHVHDWTMTNSPAGTPDWFGWANACISELVPVAALLDIRARRRSGKAIGYPLSLLIGAACLSLAAQLAVAKPGPSGWLLSAVPALAFMALVKLVFSRTPARLVQPEPAAEPATVEQVEPLAREPLSEPTEPTPAPVKAHPVQPAREPSRKPVPRSLTLADRVKAACLAEPDASNARLAELAGCSLATVKRYKVKPAVSGSAATERPAPLPIFAGAAA